MLKSNIQKKLLAIILIFTLTFANFAVVTKAYATSFAETIFGTNSDTGHKNIEFDAYFETEGNKVTSVISDVNNKDVAVASTSIRTRNSTKQISVVGPTRMDYAKVKGLLNFIRDELEKHNK